MEHYVDDDIEMDNFAIIDIVLAQIAQVRTVYGKEAMLSQMRHVKYNLSLSLLRRRKMKTYFQLIK